MASRAWLFVPGTRPERFANAAASGADEVILDLEDAVIPGAKDSARGHCAEWLRGGGFAWVRVNATGTLWHDRDLAEFTTERHPGLRGLLLPKADRAALDLVEERLDGTTPVIALVETAIGLRDVDDIAARKCVVGLAFGSLDYALDLRVQEHDEALDFARSVLAVAARAAGLPAPIDGVTPAVSDTAAVRSDAGTARRLGLGAKLCIHPAQVAAVQEAFVPTEVEVAWARIVLAKAESTGADVFQVDGRMVDRPVLLRAAEVLEGAASAAARTPQPAAPRGLL